MDNNENEEKVKPKPVVVLVLGAEENLEKSWGEIQTALGCQFQPQIGLKVETSGGKVLYSEIGLVVAGEVAYPTWKSDHVLGIKIPDPSCSACSPETGTWDGYG